MLEKITETIVRIFTLLGGIGLCIISGMLCNRTTESLDWMWFLIAGFTIIMIHTYKFLKN